MFYRSPNIHLAKPSTAMFLDHKSLFVIKLQVNAKYVDSKSIWSNPSLFILTQLKKEKKKKTRTANNCKYNFLLKLKRKKK